MQKTKIEWTDWTWNPITGCTTGCAYCYARKMAENPYYKRAFPFGFKPHFYAARLNEPGKAKAGSKIFVCSMGELFGGMDGWTNEVLVEIEHHPDLTFQVLTKQPQNLIKWSPFPENCWVGVSVTANGDMTRAFYGLRDIKASVRFLSFEPLLGRIGMSDHVPLKNAWVDWLIIGQQTPIKQATMPKIEWITEIVEAADKAKIPVFLKENLESLFYYPLPEWAEDKFMNTRLRQEYPLLREE